MNQNNQNNQVRLVSPEEVQGVSDPYAMTPEELQKTQVLNLAAVEEIADFEKRTSKKPAIILAVLGLLSITFGGTFSIVQTLTTKPTPVEHVVQRKEIVEETSKELNCIKTEVNKDDGTDTVYNIVYTFEDENLKSFQKTFSITQTAGNPTGAQTILGYTNGYEPYKYADEGYKVNVQSTPTTVIATTTVDLTDEKLATEYPAFQQTHFSTKVDFELDTKLETIQAVSTQNGFICE